MASIIFSAIGSSIGGSLGSYLGGILGNALFGSSGPDTTNEGPRLNNLKVQTSTYGTMVPIIYGSVRIGGNIFWSTDIKETKTSQEVGGKGGGPTTTTNTYTYSVSLAIALCEGEIQGIGRIWANGKLIANGVNVQPGAEHVIYTGTETQTPSPLMQAKLGTTNIPAYRGTAYIEFTDFQLADFGNSIPNFTFEVFSKAHTQKIYEVDYQGFKLVKDYNDGTNIFALRMTSNGVWDSAKINIFTGVITPLRTGIVVGVGSITIGFDAAYVETVTIYTDLGPLAYVVDEVWVVSGAEQPYFGQKNIIIFDGKTGGLKHICQTPNEGLNTTNAVSISFNKDLEVFEVASIGAGTPSITGIFLLWPEAAGLHKCEIGGVNGWKHVRSKWVRSDPNLNKGVSYAISNPTPLDYIGTPSTYYGFDYYLYMLLARDDRYTLVDMNTGTETYTGTITGASADNVSVCWDSKRRRFAIFYPITTTSVKVTYVYVHGGVITSTVTTIIDTTKSGVNSTNMLGRQAIYLLGSDRFMIILARATGDSQLFIDAETSTVTSFEALGSAYVGEGSSAGVYTNQAHYGVADNGSLFIAAGGPGTTVKYVPLGAGDGIPLSEIVADLNQKVGVAPAEYNVLSLAGTIVQGFVISNVEPVRTSLEVLNSAYFFDVVESNKILKYIKSGNGTQVFVSSDDLLANIDTVGTTDPIKLTRLQELDLPKEVNITYLDSALDYQQSTQKSKRMTSNAVSVNSTPLSIVLTSVEAKKIADSTLFITWIRRNSYEFTLPTKYMLSEPTDIFVFDYAGSTINAKLVSKTENSLGLGTYKLIQEDLEVYNQVGVSDIGKYISKFSVIKVASTVGLLLDIPILRDEDDASGFYYCAYGVNENWTGATLYKASNSDLTSYTSVASVFASALVGAPSNVLADYKDDNTIDELNTFNVYIADGELTSVSETQLLNGYNYALVGSEIIQFKRAELIGVKTYKISGLLRGRKGTEQYMATHVVGELFIKANTQTWVRAGTDLSETGVVKNYASVTFGQDLANASTTFFTLANNGLKPYSPVHIGGGIQSNGNINIQWQRRTRTGGAWLDNADTQLGETSESYSVDILNNAGAVIRTLTSASESVVYTSSAIANDFPVQTPNPLLVKVYQLSSKVGRGFVGQGGVSWNGTVPSNSSNQWRILFTSASGAISIAEVEFLESSFGINQAVNGTAISDSGTAANAFDGLDSTNWQVGFSSGVTYIGYQFNLEKNIIGYSIKMPLSALNPPTGWQFQYKRVDWRTVHTVTGESGWLVGEKRKYLF